MSSSECAAFQVNGASVLGCKDLIAKRPNETVARGYLVHGNQVSMRCASLIPCEAGAVPLSSVPTSTIEEFAKKEVQGYGLRILFL